MRTVNIWALVLLILGILVSTYFWSPLYYLATGDGLGGGYGAIFVGYPLILISVILFVIGFFTRRKK